MKVQGPLRPSDAGPQRHRSGFAVRSQLRAGSVMGTLTQTTRAVVAAIPPKLLSFEA